LRNPRAFFLHQLSADRQAPQILIKKKNQKKESNRIEGVAMLSSLFGKNRATEILFLKRMVKPVGVLFFSKPVA
jgi:hypothetical protein